MAYTTTKHYDTMLAKSQLLFLILKFKIHRTIYARYLYNKHDADSSNEEFQNKMLEEMVDKVDVDMLLNNKLVIEMLIKYCYQHRVTQHVRLNHAKQILSNHVNSFIAESDQ